MYTSVRINTWCDFYACMYMYVWLGAWMYASLEECSLARPEAHMGFQLSRHASKIIIIILGPVHHHHDIV